SEGDDQQDPIADAARAILDGHIVLSRDLAESGHYPAIDIERSASRVMHNVARPEHLQAARRLRQLWSRYQKARDLIALGAYAPGHDAELDLAVKQHDAMRALLQQDMHDASRLTDSVRQLRQLTGI
ncbi:MAG: flagellum-specific ATP synthase FliI, partial [Methylibium sp.]|nr:flagellum-specific ATP synthase FliI [Methylibium sp.]